jgi:uncharacterized DUF497 family protein
MLRKRWGESKARKNLEKHGVPFEEAYTIFHDRLSVSYHDEQHSAQDDRHVIVGSSERGRLLVVTYVVLDDDLPWLISARVAEPFERRRYMSGREIRDEGPPTQEMDDDCYVPPFDFSKGVRGRHYFPFVGITVMLDPDVAEYFPTDDMVNDALRILIGEGRATKQPPPPHPRLV